MRRCFGALQGFIDQASNMCSSKVVKGDTGGCGNKSSESSSVASEFKLCCFCLLVLSVLLASDETSFDINLF